MGTAGAGEISYVVRLCPVEFLSNDQAAAYERFAGDATRSELEGFFLLDGTALDLIANKRDDHNRLEVGLQVGTVRYRDPMPAEPTVLPDEDASAAEERARPASPDLLPSPDRAT